MLVASVPPTPSSCWKRDLELATPPRDDRSSASSSTCSGEAILFRSGDCLADGRASVCYRIPSLLVAGNTTLLAFAKAFNFSGDNCYPKPWYCGVGCGPAPSASRPVAPGDNTSRIVVRRSDNGGDTWSSITEVVRGTDFEAVYDELSGDVLVQYPGDTGVVPQPDIGNHTWQVRSTDLGITWQRPTLLGTAVLGPYDGLLVGPGRGLQLRSPAKGKRGRLLFCGHTDNKPGSPAPSKGGNDRVAPVIIIINLYPLYQTRIRCSSVI